MYKSTGGPGTIMDTALRAKKNLANFWKVWNSSNSQGGRSYSESGRSLSFSSNKITTEMGGFLNEDDGIDKNSQIGKEMVDNKIDQVLSQKKIDRGCCP